MIPGPVGALALIGSGAVMIFGAEQTTGPIAEPETFTIQPPGQGLVPCEKSPRSMPGAFP